MTLVVAAIHGADWITMASDTLITWDDDVARAPEEASLAKLMILRANVAVGVTGKDPHSRLRDLAVLRNEPVDAILDQLQEDPAAGFVVAALEPARLWEVFEGQIRKRTDQQLAWDGDREAYDIFKRRFETDWMKTAWAGDIPFRVMTAMQTLTSFRPVPTVGGITIRIGTDDDGFNFIADRGQVLFGPAWLMFIGDGPTRGALGILDSSSNLGQLFRHEAPDEPITVRVATADDFVAAAFSHGQIVKYSSW